MCNHCATPIPLVVGRPIGYPILGTLHNYKLHTSHRINLIYPHICYSHAFFTQLIIRAVLCNIDGRISFKHYNEFF